MTKYFDTKANAVAELTEKGFHETRSDVWSKGPVIASLHPAEVGGVYVAYRFR